MGDKTKANGEWKSHKYYFKLDQPGGASRYFYTKEQYDAYRNGQQNTQVTNRVSNNRQSGTVNSQQVSGANKNYRDKDSSSNITSTRGNTNEGNKKDAGSTTSSKTPDEYADTGSKWLNSLFGETKRDNDPDVLYNEATQKRILEEQQEYQDYNSIRNSARSNFEQNKAETDNARAQAEAQRAQQQAIDDNNRRMAADAQRATVDADNRNIQSQVRGNLQDQMDAQQAGKAYQNQRRAQQAVADERAEQNMQNAIRNNLDRQMYAEERKNEAKKAANLKYTKPVMQESPKAGRHPNDSIAKRESDMDRREPSRQNESSTGRHPNDSIAKRESDMDLRSEKGIVDKARETAADTQRQVSNAYNNTRDSVSDAYNNARDSVSDAYNNARDAVSDAYDNAREAVSNSVEKIGNSISSIFNDITSSISDIYDDVSWGFTKAGWALEDAVDNVIETAEDVASEVDYQIWKAGKTVSPVVDKAAQVVDDATYPLQSALDKIWSTVSESVSRKMTDVFNMPPPDIDTIHYAEAFRSNPNSCYGFNTISALDFGDNEYFSDGWTNENVYTALFGDKGFQVYPWRLAENNIPPTDIFDGVRNLDTDIYVQDQTGQTISVDELTDVIARQGTTNKDGCSYGYITSGGSTYMYYYDSYTDTVTYTCAASGHSLTKGRHDGLFPKLDGAAVYGYDDFDFTDMQIYDYTNAEINWSNYQSIMDELKKK